MVFWQIISALAINAMLHPYKFFQEIIPPFQFLPE
jgi:hypothetical protein